MTDGAGRTATAAVSVTVAPPPALTASITSPANGASVTGTVMVNMAAGNAQGSPTQFVLQLDNATTLSTQSVSGSAATYAWNTSGVAGGAHTLNLGVTDGAGRTATASVSVTVSTSPPPTVSITTPASGAWTGNSIEVKATASGAVALTSLKFWGNGAVFATAPCSATTCSGDIWWVTGSLPPAAYQVQVVATDSAGNSATSAPIVIYKDATSPLVPSGASGGTPPPALTASITSPASGATVSGMVTVNMAAGNAQGSPTQFLLQLDSAATLSSQSVSGATAAASWDTTTAANTTHTLNLTVTDGAGRTATAAITINVVNPTGGPDTVPPSVTISKPSNGAWTGNSIDVTASAGDNVGMASLTFYGDGTQFAKVSCAGAPSCQSTQWWVTGPLPSGQHTITVVATDTSGNQTTSAPVVINK